MQSRTRRQISSKEKSRTTSARAIKIILFGTYFEFFFAFLFGQKDNVIVTLGYGTPTLVKEKKSANNFSLGRNNEAQASSS